MIMLYVPFLPGHQHWLEVRQRIAQQYGRVRLAVRPGKLMVIARYRHFVYRQQWRIPADSMIYICPHECHPLSERWDSPGVWRKMGLADLHLVSGKQASPIALKFPVAWLMPVAEALADYYNKCLPPICRSDESFLLSCVDLYAADTEQQSKSTPAREARTGPAFANSSRVTTQVDSPGLRYARQSLLTHLFVLTCGIALLGVALILKPPLLFALAWCAIALILVCAGMMGLIDAWQAATRRCRIQVDDNVIRVSVSAGASAFRATMKRDDSVLAVSMGLMEQQSGFTLNDADSGCMLLCHGASGSTLCLTEGCDSKTCREVFAWLAERIKQQSVRSRQPMTMEISTVTKQPVLTCDSRAP
ncbi:MAG: hypothetical protein D8M59_06140 [Planctomycetes bacterium]|nr:hypothetical protein [Planctomycetota bacterium]